MTVEPMVRLKVRAGRASIEEEDVANAALSLQRLECGDANIERDRLVRAWYVVVPAARSDIAAGYLRTQHDLHVISRRRGCRHCFALTSAR
jgi:hypothetical protein